MTVTIGCWAGFWGDSPRAAEQVLRGAPIDYLVGDHLAEITMALLARARMKDPQAGYVPDVISTLAPLLEEIQSRGVKVISNGGGLNPAACAQALRDAAAHAGVPVRVAYVEGDDVTALLPRLRALGVRDMFTGEELPEQPLTANAYLGARPIATALDMGADIVVTGRCVDSAIVLGPLMHEFGWRDSDYDHLAAGTLIGHVIECGPQCLGGLFTDWWAVPGWEDMGYPLAECHRDGTAVITKPSGTGGLVTPATVAEQILYEIGDPGAYTMPEVVCDWREVHTEQDGEDRVVVGGARGSAPSQQCKATITATDGYRVVAEAFFAGLDAPGRARRAGTAMIARAERLATAAGHGPFTETTVEVVGGGDGFGRPGSVHDGREALLRVGARHPNPAALEMLARERGSFGLVAQGMTGLGAGRAKPQPVIRLFHALVEQTELNVTVNLEGERRTAPLATGKSDVPIGARPLPEPHTRAGADRDRITVPLRRIAYARSGDKGNDANIGVIARSPEFAAVIREQVTAARVRDVFGAWLCGPVHRYELPGLNAINIVLRDVLGGRGGTSSLRLDPQGKSYAAILLDLAVSVPASWEREGQLAADASKPMVLR
jgi:Acyclic terpene utilisation family protein AtuA